MTQVTFTGQKLSTQFNVKDRTKFEHKHDVIYFVKCPIILVNLLGESEAIVDHGGWDQKSHPFRHAVVNDHHNANFDDFIIIWSSFRNNKFKRRVGEALLNKELQPTLNIQKSVELKLFN